MASKKARVLVDTVIDGVAVKPNQVVEGSAAKIKSLGDVVDASPEAVEFCLAEFGTKIVDLGVSQQEDADEKAKAEAEAKAKAEAEAKAKAATSQQQQ